MIPNNLGAGYWAAALHAQFTPLPLSGNSDLNMLSNLPNAGDFLFHHLTETSSIVVLAGVAIVLAGTPGARGPGAGALVSFGLAAVSLLLLSYRKPVGQFRIRAALLLAFAVAAGGLMEISGNPQTGASVMLIGSGLFCLTRPDASFREMAPVAALIVLAATIASILFHSYGVSALAAFGNVPFMDIVLLFFTAVALFFAYTGSGVAAIFQEPGTGGVVARCLLLPFVLVAPYLGLLTGLGSQHEEDLTILLLLANFAFPPLLWITACRLQDLERAKTRAYDELYSAHQQLNKEIAELISTQDQLQKALKARSEFMAKVSHELRTPVAAILGSLELAQLEPGNELLNTAAQAATDLLRLINDILDFAYLESKQVRLEYHGVSVRSLVRSVLQSLQSRADAKGLKLSASVAPDIPESIHGDSGRLKQVLLNLVDNAIKFTAAGHVNVEVTTTGNSEQLLRFAVTDTGSGIAPEQQVKIFEPFIQADNSSCRRFGGIGLGLSICKDLVELMQGRIGCQSEPGAGTTFWFEIPVEGNCNRVLRSQVRSAS